MYTNYGIGGYSLRKEDNGINEGDYTNEVVSLLYGDDKVATYMIRGEGSSRECERISADSSNDESVNTIEENVLEDYISLLDIFKDLSVDAFCYNFLDNACSAADGWVKLLMELGDVVEEAEKARVETDKDNFYVIGMVGRSMLKAEGGYESKVYSILDVEDFTEAEVTGMNNETVAENGGSVVALAVLKGEFDWHLSFEQYRILYSPYES